MGFPRGPGLGPSLFYVWPGLGTPGPIQFYVILGAVLSYTWSLCHTFLPTVIGLPFQVVIERN